MRKFTLIVCLSLFFYTNLFSQSGKLTVEVGIYGGGATDSLQPLWNYANQWGTFSSLTKGEGVFTGKVSYHFLDKKNISMKAGVAGIAKTDFSESFVQEAFLRMKFWWFDVSAGLEAYSPVAYNDELSSGMFLISSNARPIPKVTVGIYYYLPLGFTRNWVEIRGAITQGFLGDRGPIGNSDVLLHEKWAYVRLGNLNWKPYAGIVHSALYGGTKPNGEKIPIDFWATFRAQPSARVGGGDATNAAGGHMGLWDFGIYFPVKNWKGHFYYQKPFADGSGMRILNFRNKDYYFGLRFNKDEKSAVTGIAVELIKTTWGSGPGTPDPYDPEENHVVFPSQIEDIDAYMMERFEMETNGWTDKDLTLFLEDEWNNGYEFGGRDPYMNNGLYPAGWTHKELSMGTPLLHTEQFASYYVDGYGNRMFFVNNRVNSFHIGLEGWLNNLLFYRLKGTYSNNKGNYCIEYGSCNHWNRVDNYYYAGGKNQYYTGLEVNWQIKNDLPVKIIGVIGYDFGELYHSFGGRLGVVYKIGSPTLTLP